VEGTKYSNVEILTINRVKKETVTSMITREMFWRYATAFPLITKDGFLLGVRV